MYIVRVCMTLNLSYISTAERIDYRAKLWAASPICCRCRLYWKSRDISNRRKPIADVYYRT